MENKGKKTIYISASELARMLGISRVAVFKRIKKGQIPAHKIGRNYAICMEDVADLIGGTEERFLTDARKTEIKKAVQRVVDEYGETLKLLGKE